jgi:hypothetical protein
MAQTTDALEADIAHTREDASAAMGAIGDQLSPRRAVNVGKQRLRQWIRSAREGVMGSASDVEGHAGKGGAEGSGVMTGQSQGNPLAAGIIAFGVGLLAGSIAPPTKVEQKGLVAIADKAEPAMSAAIQTASELGHGLQKSTEQAASQLGGVITDAGQQIVEQTQASSNAAETVEPPATG